MGLSLNVAAELGINPSTLFGKINSLAIELLERDRPNQTQE